VFGPLWLEAANLLPDPWHNLFVAVLLIASLVMGWLLLINKLTEHSTLFGAGLI
jgi:hypothetical protein